jgi:IS605 OrfB family transposase
LYRTILLQTEATNSKLAVLSEFQRRATRCINWLFSRRASLRKSQTSLSEFWRLVGKETKNSTGFNSQVVCDLVRFALRFKGDAVNNVTVRFNVPRNCKTFATRGFFFVEIGLYPRKRVALPIRRNRNLERFFGLLQGGWSCSSFGLTPTLQVAAYLAKNQAEPAQGMNLLGVDVNAKQFAYSVVTPQGKILRQGYLGKHIWIKRKGLMRRRAHLQSIGNARKLQRMRGIEADFVRTNLGQVVREVVGLAKAYDACIVIEKLRRFLPKGRRFNKKAMSIPFYAVRQILEARCFDKGIALNAVNPWHTSKWCIRCGAVNAGHSANYSVFRCAKCGLAMNADRKASVAIAVKALLDRKGYPGGKTFQISGRRVPVVALLKSNEASVRTKAVPLSTAADESSQL